MKFTNVLPGVKLVKQNEAGNEEELFLSQNDHVIVKTLNGREITRHGQLQPCDRIAIAHRIDTDNHTYPV